jgi:LacI family transcriptional regulator
MPITIKDIADLCGVSPGTVDRALNNRLGISVKTKRKIMKAAMELRYRPSHAAQSLARGKTMTLGVVLFDLHNRSFAQLMNAIQNKARECDYFVDLVLTDKDPLKEKEYIEHLISRRVDGIILFSVNMGSDFDQYLQSLDIPIVTVGNWISDKWKYIGINDRTAMKDATNYILDRGYQRIIYICPPLSYRGVTNIFTQEERLIGCTEAMRAHEPGSGPVVIQDTDFLRALDRIDLTGNERTAILCSCDYYALEVMNDLKAKGLDIPGDVGLMGFDNIDMLKYVSPSLTTVEYNVEEMGIQAMETLLGLIEQDDSSLVPLLDYSIIPGNSL